MGDDPRATFGELLEAAHRRLEQKVRHHEMLRAMKSLEAAQTKVVELATRGAKDAARQAKAGEAGGRRLKADPADVRAALNRYRAEYPHHSSTAAAEAVAADFGIDPRSVRRYLAK